MHSNPRGVVLGMSGGVDSSVAALVLQREGFKVIGVTLLLYPEESTCCSLEDIEDARRVAASLGIEHRVVDCNEEFMTKIVAPFVEGYTGGITPSPCPLCNAAIRFTALLREAERFGYARIATGHYARITKECKGHYLIPGVDDRKSQDYYLSLLPEEILARTLFPLGPMMKDAVVVLAHQADLPVRGKRESQDICFVPDGDYPAFLKRCFSVEDHPGPIVDRSGRVLGEHRGLFYYTVGQRKGLGIAAPRPLYVLRLDSESNAVVVGEREEAMVRHARVRLSAWRPIDPAGPFTVKLRYRHPPAPVAVTLNGEQADLLFDDPQFAPAPGQLAVFYDTASRVIGAGTVATPSENSSRNDPALESF